MAAMPEPINQQPASTTLPYPPAASAGDDPGRESGSMTTPSPARALPLTNFPSVITRIFGALPIGEAARAMRCSYTMWKLLASSVYRHLTVDGGGPIPVWNTVADHPQRSRGIRFDLVRTLIVDFSNYGPRDLSSIPNLPKLESLGYAELRNDVLPNIPHDFPRQPQGELTLSSRQSDLAYQLVPIPVGFERVTICILPIMNATSARWSVEAQACFGDTCAGRNTPRTALLRFWLSSLPSSVQLIQWVAQVDTSDSGKSMMVVLSFFDGENSRLREVQNLNTRCGFEVYDYHISNIFHVSDEASISVLKPVQGSKERPYVYKRVDDLLATTPP